MVTIVQLKAAYLIGVTIGKLNTFSAYHVTVSWSVVVVVHGSSIVLVHESSFFNLYEKLIFITKVTSQKSRNQHITCII